MSKRRSVKRRKRPTCLDPSCTDCVLPPQMRQLDDIEGIIRDAMIYGEARIGKPR